jgi:hypothetical protein
MRDPHDVVLEHAQCPVHLQGEVLRVEPPSAWPGLARVTVRVLRGLRGPIEQGQELTFQVLVDPNPPPAEERLECEWGWVAQLKLVEVCLTAELQVPSTDSLWGLEAPGSPPVLQFPPQCPWCPDGFLEPLPPRPAADRLIAAGFVLTFGGLGAMGLLFAANALWHGAAQVIPWLCPLVVLGLFFLRPLVGQPRREQRCSVCGATVAGT